MPQNSKILLIDDERLLLKATSMVLRHAGFEVANAANGQAGIEAARAESPDLILLDIMMPGMDGWEVLEILKGDPRTAAVPVVIFTAKEHLDGYRMSLDAGASDYLTKPFDNEDMLRRIRILIADRAGGSPNQGEGDHADG